MSKLAFKSLVLTLMATLICAGCDSEKSQCVQRNFAKKMNFISITRWTPKDVPGMISEAKRLADGSGVRKNAYLLGILPKGKNPSVLPQRYAKIFAELRQGLQNEDIEVGILIQSLVGHGWPGAHKDETGMTFAINQKGGTVFRHCMLDEKFRSYVKEAIRTLAKAKPAFFLIDDDTRTINNGSNGVECFCDNHMKIYYRILPKKFANHTELREYLIKAPASDPVVRAFEKQRRETILGFAKLIREAIDSVDENIPCGYCSGGGEYILAGDIARTLAGKNESFLRINNANYLERGPRDFQLTMFHTAFKTKAAGKIDYILDESDTLPHSLYGKSSISMHAHITGAILNGAAGGKLWITSTLNKIPQTTEAYEKILKKHHNFYNTLLNEMPNVTWIGAVTPLPPFGRDFNPARFRDGVVSWNDFQYQIFHWHGIPGRYDFVGKNQVALLTGSIVDSLNDEELKTLLSHRALVDGYAAIKLYKRGFGSYIGCVPVVEPFRTSGEYPRFMSYRLRFQNNFTLPKLTQLAPGAEILSDLKLNDADGTSTIVAPGSFIYTNPAGGKVIVRANAVAENRYNITGEEVKLTLIDALRRLDPECIQVYLSEEIPAYIRVGKHSDGSYMVALVNLSFDAMKNIELFCDLPVKQVEYMDHDGIYRRLDFVKNGKTLTVKHPVACYETVILKLK